MSISFPRKPIDARGNTLLRVDVRSIQTSRKARDKISAGMLRFLVVLLGIIWGLQISLAKVTGEEVGATSAGLLLIHIFLATTFIAFQVFKGQMFIPTLREIGFYAVGTVLVNIAPLWLELTIAPHMSAGLLTLISSMSPILTVAFVMLLKAEQVTLQRMLGVLVGAAAAATVLIPQAAFGDATLKWTAIAFALPITLAAYGVFMRRAWPSGRTPMQVSTGILVAGTAILVPFHFTTNDLPFQELDNQYGSLPLLLLAVSIGAEFYLFSLLIRLGGAIIASCADYIAVLVGLGWGYMLFNERPDTGLWLAVGLGFLALWLICKQQKPLRQSYQTQQNPRQ
jgi:drug/metabolite transporter (DMT)-like permease